MDDKQNDIDALLAEVNALADQAVADIAGSAESPGTAQPDRPAQGDDTTNPSPQASASARAGYPVKRSSGSITKADAATENAPTSDGALARLLKIELPVIVHLAENRMPLSEIMRLSTGAIIEFEKGFDSELDLRVNNMCIGQGEAVKVGENFGLRITRIGSVRDRIQALGQQ